MVHVIFIIIVAFAIGAAAAFLGAYIEEQKDNNN